MSPNRLPVGTNGSSCTARFWRVATARSGVNSVGVHFRLPATSAAISR